MYGIRRIAPIGNGTGWTVSLIGGSNSSTSTYLKAQLPGAALYDLGEMDTAYMTRSGVVARSKRELVGSLGVTSVSISEQGARTSDFAAAAALSPVPWTQHGAGQNIGGSSASAYSTFSPAQNGPTPAPRRSGS